MNEIEKLHLWFEENKREFPWREERTPYRVWVSEVMLQQTRASVVIPYFIRWMKLFPDIKSLAQASLSTVIKSWEGLGYYSRARRLHEGAKDIYHRFKGTLPSCPDQLRSIKGLGPYTIGAILNFGFHKKAPAIDGNVIRVLSRYFSIEENVGRASTKRLLEQKVNIWLENSAPWVTSEALIELGATICLPKPQCSICPIHSDCLGFSSGKASMLPIKTSSPEIIDLYRMVAVIESDGFFLVKKAEPGKVMADLYEFPYFEIKKGDWDSIKLIRAVKKSLKCSVRFVSYLDLIKHSFTRYRAWLYPSRLEVKEKMEIQGWEWISLKNLLEIPFSSGHRKIVECLNLQETK